MASSHFATVPVFVYGCLLMGAGCRLQPDGALPSGHPRKADSLLAILLGKQQAAPKSISAAASTATLKGKLSTVLYSAALVLVWVNTWIAYAIYITVALMWIIPGPAHRVHAGGIGAGQERSLTRGLAHG